MALSTELISKFAKITNNNEKSKLETTVYGTVVEHNGKKYVKIDGSEILTPVASMIKIEDQERVSVMIKNHTATVTGNLSSPAITVVDTSGVTEKINEFEIAIGNMVSTDELTTEIATVTKAINAANENINALEAIVTENSQKILWQGGMHMTADNTVNLSEKISEQKTGIVLVFSKYSNGDVENNNFNSFFIPKIFVSLHNGCGSEFAIADNNFSKACHKYLYIYDDHISGHAQNSATGTGSSGITYANNAYVLRYVYGV